MLRKCFVDIWNPNYWSIRYIISKVYIKVWHLNFSYNYAIYKKRILYSSYKQFFDIVNPMLKIIQVIFKLGFLYSFLLFSLILFWWGVEILLFWQINTVRILITFSIVFTHKNCIDRFNPPPSTKLGLSCPKKRNG